MILFPAAALLLTQAAVPPPWSEQGVAAPQLVVAVPRAPADHPGAVVVPKQTMVRLMVLNEVNTRTARPGTRFVLRVDENVLVAGVVVIPVGAKAWGEVTEVVPNKALGRPGAIGARLLYVEAGGERVMLSGEEQSRGSTGADRIAMLSATVGPFALFTKGNIGKLKAGFIFNGYFASDRLFDTATGRFVPAPEAEGRAR